MLQCSGTGLLFFGRSNQAQVQNWVRTTPGKRWVVYLRLCEPKEVYFDKSWQLNDIQEVSPGILQLHLGKYCRAQ